MKSTTSNSLCSIGFVKKFEFPRPSRMTNFPKKAEQKLGVKTKEGFYRWDDEKIVRTRQRYMRDLRRALEILRDQDG